MAKQQFRCYLKFLGRFVDFHLTITALLVPFQCFEYAAEEEGAGQKQKKKEKRANQDTTENELKIQNFMYEKNIIKLLLSALHFTLQNLQTLNSEG